MKELLQRWAELEPERCRIPGNSSTAEDQEVFIDEAGHQIWNAQSGLERGLVQIAVQEAIAARGWTIRVESLYHAMDDSYIYDSIVFASNGGFNWRSFGEESTMAAESLLSAYLKALEKAKEKS